MIRAAHLYKNMTHEQKCDSYTVKMFLIESFWSVTESVEIHLVRMWEQNEAVPERSDKDQTQKINKTEESKKEKKEGRKKKKERERKEGKKTERQTNKEGRKMRKKKEKRK